MRKECDRSATGVRQECDRSATGVRQECDELELRGAPGVRQVCARWWYEAAGHMRNRNFVINFGLRPRWFLGFGGRSVAVK